MEEVFNGLKGLKGLPRVCHWNFNCLVLIPVAIYYPYLGLLRISGWRDYLHLHSPWLGWTAEFVTAMLPGIGALYFFPQPLVWIFSRLMNLTNRAEYTVFAAGYRHWKNYIYLVAIVAFMGYLWVNKNRVK